MGHTERDPTAAERHYPFAGVKPLRRESLLRSFKFAWQGLAFAFRSQPNFRVHLTVATGVAALGLWLRLPVASWAILSITVGIVLVAEILNTAAEALVDLVSPDYHPLAKQVKDLTAGAVLVFAIVSVAVGLLVLGPPLLAKLGLA